MPFDFNGKTVLITGAAGNLGRATARAFLETGANLVLVDSDIGRLEGAFGGAAESARILIAPSTDVTDEESAGKAVSAALERFGRIDVLVNIAGGYRAGTPLHQTPLSDWEFMLSLNARSVFVVCRRVIPAMLRAGGGRIVNIGSRAAEGGDAGHSAYSASKTAVVRLTESMAAELKDSGINVNCVMPGIIDTPPNRAAMPDADFSRWVRPEAIAEVILFLASDSASAVQGAAIPVYGRG